jgi:hypothetical protein
MAHEWAEGRDWSDFEMDMYERMAHDTDALDDPMMQSMFDLAYFDQDVSHDIRENAREWLDEYIADEYGFDFDDWFDWEAWREAYGEAA